MKRSTQEDGIENHAGRRERWRLVSRTSANFTGRVRVREVQLREDNPPRLFRTKAPCA